MEKSEGIILKSVDYGEANKILTVLTRKHGKIGLMARGAKKANSRLSSISQVMSYGQLLYKKSQGLGWVSQGEILNGFRHLKSDIVPMAYASYVIDLTNQLIDQNETNPFLFEWLLHTLNYMDEGLDPKVLTLIYDVKMLPQAGIAAELDGCAHCGRFNLPMAFSVTNGGFLCAGCSYHDRHALPISEAAAKLLRMFKHINLNRLGKIHVKKSTIREMDQVMSLFYEQYSGVKLKSKQFLKQIEELDSR
ncbi:DNA repair protein RecO [Tuberibacillus sp. Marseille-P3662]|uniref:DNA repair protein RecO n=1 Tax=Tuberibacillus sp. Marseille-P3662 TaxID=1965358 RepID=UPI0020CB52F0|nr:DNA repair protein RecO [Tuberibacillus sp. Marseille-P3662]